MREPMNKSVDTV